MGESLSKFSKFQVTLLSLLLAAGVVLTVLPVVLFFHLNETSGIQLDKPAIVLLICFPIVANIFFVSFLALYIHTKERNCAIFKKLEALRSQLTESEKNQQELVESNKAKGVFLANMSHEIRTPLNGLVGNLQLLKDESLSDEAEENVELCLRSSQLLGCIINDILDFSKIEEGKLDLEYAPFDLSVLVNDTVNHIAFDCKQKSIGISIQNNVKHHYRLGDQTRIKQILLNILTNAVKFTHQGGIEVIIDSDRNENVRFSVIDSGIGMSEEALSHLFERFEQADRSITRKYGGSGLGMSIVYGLCELMGGSVNVASKEGKGTKISFSLPLAKEVRSEVESRVKRKSEVDLAGLNVLLAEDNAINQKLIGTMLGKEGVEVTIASNGQEALEMMNDDFDLVLMDIQMPIMNGVEACVELREQGVVCPVLALTANVMKDDVDKYLSSGFDEVIAKPIDRVALNETLMRYRIERISPQAENVILSA